MLPKRPDLERSHENVHRLGELSSPVLALGFLEHAPLVNFRMAFPQIFAVLGLEGLFCVCQIS